MNTPNLDALIETAARAIFERQPPRIGRAGWKHRALVEARKLARARFDAWTEAERAERRRDAERAHQRKRDEAKAADDAAGLVRLVDDYGRSYFGSGGALGKVHLLNAEVLETADTGFIVTPRVIRVIDRNQVAAVQAYGSDCIGDDGRSWSEHYTWIPSTQTWVGGQTHASKLRDPLLMSLACPQARGFDAHMASNAAKAAPATVGLATAWMAAEQALLVARAEAAVLTPGPVEVSAAGYPGALLGSFASKGDANDLCRALHRWGLIPVVVDLRG